jgi:hypothetical protein
VKPTAVPDTLVLRGISGTPQRRFALVNDTTLEKGEQAKVRVAAQQRRRALRGNFLTLRCSHLSTGLRNKPNFPSSGSESTWPASLLRAF